nr:unnamed protein product [Callosobruchus analis]
MKKNAGRKNVSAVAKIKENCNTIVNTKNKGTPKIGTPKKQTCSKSLSYFDEEGYFCCATCHKRYKRKHGLNQHQRLECNKPPQFCCKLCPKAFKQKNNLKVHVYSVHKVPFVC